MAHYIAFLRGINLGNRRIKMDDLAAQFVALKFADVSTFIASGNVAFTTTATDAAKLEAKIESHLRQELGYDVDTFVRTRAEVAAAATFPAFPAADTAGPENTIHVGFLKAPLGKEAARLLVAARTPVDEFTVSSREFYWLCRIKTNESKVWSSAAMKAVKLPTATMRNRKMLVRLVEAFPAAQ